MFLKNPVIQLKEQCAIGIFLMREKIKAIISSKEVLIITLAKISSCQTIFPFEMLVNGFTLLRFMETI